MVREYRKEDYKTLHSWWEAQKWPPVPEAVLPPTGFVVDGVCAGFLYKSDASIAWMEWIVANPSVDKDERNRALDLLINTIGERAHSLGYTFLFTSTKHTRLSERLVSSHNYILAESEMTNLFCNLAANHISRSP